MFAVLVRLVSFCFCYLLPAYSSFKSLRSGNRKTVIKLLIHYTVISLLVGLEAPLDFALGWLPFYSLFKFGTTLWLTLPQTQGTIFVYRNIIHPQFLKYEAKIDQQLAQVEATAWHYTLIVKELAIEHGRKLVLLSLQEGQRLVLQYLQDPSRLIALMTVQYVNTVQALSVPRIQAVPNTQPSNPTLTNDSVLNIHELSDDDEIDSFAQSSTVETSTTEDAINIEEDYEDDNESSNVFEAAAASPSSTTNPSFTISVLRTPKSVKRLSTSSPSSLLSSPSSSLRRRLAHQQLSQQSPRTPKQQQQQQTSSVEPENDAPFSDADVEAELRLSSPWRVLNAMQLSKPTTSDEESQQREIISLDETAIVTAATLPAITLSAPCHDQVVEQKHAKGRTSKGKAMPLKPAAVINRTSTMRNKSATKPASTKAQAPAPAKQPLVTVRRRLNTARTVIVDENTRSSDDI